MKFRVLLAVNFFFLVSSGLVYSGDGGADNVFAGWALEYGNKAFCANEVDDGPTVASDKSKLVSLEPCLCVVACGGQCEKLKELYGWNDFLAQSLKRGIALSPAKMVRQNRQQTSADGGVNT